MNPVGYGTRISELAAVRGAAVAVTCGDDHLSWAQLDRAANATARLYGERGVRHGQIVSIALPNGIPLIVHCIAAWKIGAVPNPVSPRLPEPEWNEILDKACPAIIVTGPGAPGCRWPLLIDGADLPADDSPLPDAVSPHERALASGGSTGRPKLIVVAKPAAYAPGAAPSVLAPRGSVLIPGPLYHAAPFGSATQALLAGVHTVLMPRFDAAACVALIERHRIEQVLFVPTMMHRIWHLPDAQRTACDVSSLRVVFTGGAPCPQWLMRAWIDWLGADVMHELYGPSERIGGTHISGREWLHHPGSVGRPTSAAAIRILDPETLAEMPAGAIGEVFMMPREGRGSTYRYVGAESRATDDGWESVGDMGYLDADGYLFLTDRRTDMILCGGRNVYPAQVEAAIDSFPGVLSSAVIGLPDDDLGNRIHAVVQADRIDEQALRAHIGAQIAGYEIPHSFEVVDFPLRDDAGKVRRYQLREERLQGALLATDRKDLP
jgi:bile acid-coenzyme A ligase